MTTLHSFNVTDRLGRVMGLATETFDECNWWGKSTPGRYTYVTNATRDGRKYQALHGGKTFSTAAERDADMARAVKAAEKRALQPAARMRA